MRPDDKARFDATVRQLQEVRATFESQLQQALALADRALSAGRYGGLDASFSARISSTLEKKSAELQTADALLDAVNVPATPHNTQLYMDLVNLLVRISETDGFYSSLPGQNPVVDQMFAELKAKTKELNQIVRADLARRKDKEFEKDMSRLGFALGLLLFK